MEAMISIKLIMIQTNTKKRIARNVSGNSLLKAISYRFLYRYRVRFRGSGQYFFICFRSVFVKVFDK